MHAVHALGKQNISSYEVMELLNYSIKIKLEYVL